MYTIEIDQEDLENILEAIEAQRRKALGLGNKPLQGFRAGEAEKKAEWLNKADAWNELATKISYQTI